MFWSRPEGLENSFFKYDKTTAIKSRYSRLLAEYFNRRLGLHSIPEYADWTDNKLLAEMEEAEKERTSLF
jgi:hypothetical protein